MTVYFNRSIESLIHQQLHRGKSIILLGPRQTGKTTLLKNCLKFDFDINLIVPGQRLKFEKRPDDLIDMIEGFLLINHSKRQPLVMIDEIQRVPALMDVIQYLIDNQKAQFVLTGSSARKLKHGQEQALNLLPGRLVYLTLDALSLEELPLPIKPLEILMQDGLLPGIYLEELSQSIDIDLQSYVEVYLEEEIRQEGIVRNLQAFSRFLELAALTIGEPINFTSISQKIGVSTHQIIEYYQILEDCMIAWRIDAISAINNRRRLTKAPKFLFFDMGVRRYCAKEGRHFSEREKGLIFEQFIGVELMKLIHLHQPMGRLKYWRDHNGPEVDYVIDIHHQYLPIEVKLTENPKIQDCRHLTKFLAEYPCYSKGFLVCRCEEIRVLAPNIIALPWQLLPKIFELSQKVL